MQGQFSRTTLMFGEERMEKLYSSHIAVFGIGGVGGYVAEALVRSGISHIDLIDNDTVNLSNLNRQIIATYDTLNEYKTDAAKKRILSINPNAQVNTYNLFITPETSNQIDFSKYDYIADCIDTVSGKLELITKAKQESVKIISCMGTGNKINPCELEVDDIYNTSVCPLARVIRSECRKRGIDSLKVLYSKEKPLKPITEQRSSSGKPVPASNSFVPSCAGIIIASEIIKDITGIQNK